MLKIGTKVIAKDRKTFGNEPATVIGRHPVMKNVFAVKYERPPIPMHDAHGQGPFGRCWYFLTEEVEVVAKPKKVRVIGPGTQLDRLLKHLLSGRSITPLHARAHYGIEALPRRIADLKEAGHKIKVVYRTDPTGKRYAEYSLRRAA